MCELDRYQQKKHEINLVFYGYQHNINTIK